VVYDKDKEIARLRRQLETASAGALWTAVGKTHTEAQQWEEAAKAYREALRQKQDEDGTFRAHFGLGRALRFLGKLDDAVSHLKEAARLRPDRMEAQLVLGLTCTEADRFDEAEPVLKEATRRWPKEAGPHQLLGMMWFERRRYADAVHALEQAATLGQADAEPVAVLGFSYAELGRADDAAKALRQAVRINPDLVIAWEALLYLGMDLRDQAGIIEATRSLGRLSTKAKAAGRERDITGAPMRKGGYELAEYEDGAICYVNVDGTRRDVYWIGVSRKEPGKYIARLEAPKDIYLNLNYSPPEAKGLVDRVARHWLRFRWESTMQQDTSDEARHKVRTTLHYRPELVGIPKVITRPDGEHELMDDRPMHDTPTHYCVYVADNRQGLVVRMPPETMLTGRS
jgi:tetratricopeptide (TPR) repeat protein